jgi:hypothetical protein
VAGSGLAFTEVGSASLEGRDRRMYAVSSG